jgi:hypothetical protein
MKLLSIGSDSKTTKGEKYGYLTGILYLAPSDVSGLINTCPHASKGCRLACLYSAGRGAFSNVQKARIEKTRRFVQEQEEFFSDLVKDISSLITKAQKEGKIPCVRLNGTSDIEWEKHRFQGLTIFQRFPNVTFYDYTKNKRRMVSSLSDHSWPMNYSLTFSRSESNQKACEEVLALGGNVAAVFRVVPPESFGVHVVDGDLSDLRFLDPAGVVVGLKAKGKAKRDLSGFVL